MFDRSGSKSIVTSLYRFRRMASFPRCNTQKTSLSHGFEDRAPHRGRYSAAASATRAFRTRRVAPILSRSLETAAMKLPSGDWAARSHAILARRSRLSGGKRRLSATLATRPKRAARGRGNSGHFRSQPGITPADGLASRPARSRAWVLHKNYVVFLHLWAKPRAAGPGPTDWRRSASH